MASVRHVIEHAALEWHLMHAPGSFLGASLIFSGSLSFGAPRVFEVRRKPRRGDTDRTLHGDRATYAIMQRRRCECDV